MDLKKITNREIDDKNLFLVIKIIVLVCGTYLSFVYNILAVDFFMRFFKDNKDHVFYCILLIATFVFAGLYYILFRWNFLEKLYSRLREKTLTSQILICLFSALSAGTYVVKFYENAGRNLERFGGYEKWWYNIPSAMGINAPSEPSNFPNWLLSLVLFIPLLLLFLYFTTAICDFLISFLKTLTKNEKRFLIIASAIALVYITFLFTNTNMYYAWHNNFYSFDSFSDPVFLKDPFHDWTYYNYQLLPNFTMPILLLAKMFSPAPIVEIILMAFVQFVLLLVCIVIFSRIVSKKPKIRFFVILVFTFSFQTMILAFIPERRVIPLVFLIFAVYHSLYIDKNDKKDGDDKFWLSLAAGAIISNVCVFFAGIRSKKAFIKDLIFCGLVFLFLAAFLGKIAGIIGINDHVEKYSGAGWMDADLDTKTILIHYLVLISSFLIAPLSGAAEENRRWWQSPIDSGGHEIFVILGIIIFTVAIAGFVLNYKNRFAQISLAAIAISVYLIFFRSLNLGENAVVLNTTMFAWAFIALCVMALEKVFKKKKIIYGILATTAGICFVYNMIMVVRIYNFAVEFAPA